MTLYPQNTAEAVEIIKEARSAKKEIFPAGRKTRLSNWPGLADDAHVISSEKMNQVVSVEPENLLAIVGAGISPAEVTKAIAPAGLYWPVSGQYNRSLGAMMAEGAVSLETMARGPMIDWILGATFIEPGGLLVSSGGRTLKNVSGYDLTRFQWKSWGSLGFSTQFILKCLPLPEVSTVLEIKMPDAKSAVETIEKIILARVFPQSLHAVLNDGQWSILLWLNGFSEYVNTQAESVKRVSPSNEMKTHSSADDFWNAHQSLWPLSPHIASWHASRSVLLTLIEKLEEEKSIKRADIDLGSGYARLDFGLQQAAILDSWPKDLYKTGPLPEGEVYLKIKHDLDPEDLFFPSKYYSK